MASRTETITHYTDDIDGSKAAGTTSFAFDGTNYEIDLSKKNRAAFEKALKPYIDSARKVRSTRSSKSTRAARDGRSRDSSPKAVGSGRSDLSDIRAWARDQGQPVSDRGRIPQAVVDAYDAAH